jgi:hypothetical protein
VPDHGHSAKTVYLPPVNPFFLTLSLSFTQHPRRRRAPRSRRAPPSCAAPPRARSSPCRRPLPAPLVVRFAAATPLALAAPRLPSRPRPSPRPPGRHHRAAAPRHARPPSPCRRSSPSPRRLTHPRPRPPAVAPSTPSQACRRALHVVATSTPSRPFALVHRPHLATRYKLILRF